MILNYDCSHMGRLGVKLGISYFLGKKKKIPRRLENAYGLDPCWELCIPLRLLI